MRILDTRSMEKLVSHEDCDNNNDIPSACHKLNPSDLRFSVNWNKFLMQLEQIFHDFLHSCIWTYIQLVALQLSPIGGATIIIGGATIINIEHDCRLKGKPESHDDRDRDQNEFRMFNSVFIANVCTLVKSHRLQFFCMSHDENQLIKCLILLVLSRSSCDSRFL